MVQRGVDSYNRAQSEAEKNGRGSETVYARRLLREYMLPLTEALRDFVETKRPGTRGRIRPLLAQVAPEKAMFMALQSLFNSFTFDAPLASLAVRIGRMVEDEIRFTRFEEQHGDYYRAIIEDFRRKGTQDYRYKHRVLTHKANEHVDQWLEWTPTERAEIGMKLLDIILINTDLVDKVEFRQHGKTKVLLKPTADALKWVDEHNDYAALLYPDKMPCIIPPDDWTGLDQGGFYSPELRQQTPLVKTNSKRHVSAIKRADLSRVMDAVNHLQKTPWEVNAEVLTIVKAVWAKNLSIGMPQREPLTVPDSPFKGRDKETLTEAEQEALTDWKREAVEIYTQEKERVSKCFQITRILRMANEYSLHGKFWYVWYADFRGRLYTATASFSPQGPDLAKGTIRLANGKALGERGWFWLRVHGANRYGYDKVSYEDRVQWVDTNREKFLAAANDPLSHRDVWATADKPYQFLAWLFEYRDCYAHMDLGCGPESFVSRVAVGLDGSCNGLQNFSAALRDDIGGRATNLVPSSVPADIYSEVAQVATGKLHAAATDPESAAIAARWIAFCEKHGKGAIPRSMAKRPVMTLPYGATRQSCTQYIFLSILEMDREHFEGNFKAACWLTPLLWESIGEVVIAARAAMDWLQKCSSAISKENNPVIWDTNDGFRVFQGTMKIETVRVQTQLAGRFDLRVGNYSDKIDGIRQRNAIAPNFVHSQDAAHLRETIRRCALAGLNDVSVIHDDYGTYAADTDKLHQIIREAFVSLYEDHDPLMSFKEYQESVGFDLPELPPKGSLDIKGVLTSRYFFG